MNDLGDSVDGDAERSAPAAKTGAIRDALPSPEVPPRNEAVGFSSDKVNLVRIDADQAGQRIDNFLLRLAKGVPKSHVYRVIRDGEVRVNKKRVDATYRLAPGDALRLPPMRTAGHSSTGTAPDIPATTPPAEFPVLFEDDHLLVVDKPAGVAVHGGSGVAFGVIEQLRASRREARFLELVHRLDRETSGVLLLAKKRSALTSLHEQMRAGQTDKRYLTLVAGDWQNARQHVRLPLVKWLVQAGSGGPYAAASEGERRVRVADAGDENGLAAHTVFSLREKFQSAQGRFALLEAELKTGRTHQIRVHLAELGFPIAGDDKYGDFALNKILAKPGAERLRRMFLHAWRIEFVHPASGEALRIESPLPADCGDFLDALRRNAGAVSTA